jgi:uncharacterized phage protein (TIGR01671 family)
MQNMDRFKFRGFYKGKMYEVFSFCNDFVKLVIDGEIQKVLRSEVVLMQATGLKDKNGKLIFEDDVIKSDCKMSNSHLTGEVVFDGGCFRIKNNAWFSHLDNLEIIGNRFENPELLHNL